MAGPEDVRAAIRAVNKMFCSAFKRASAAEIAALYAVDGQILPPNGDTITGTNALQEFWQGAFDMGLKEAKLESSEIDVFGGTAVEVGRYAIAAAGGVEADRGKYITIWKNHGGQWKLHRDIWNSSKPA